MLRLQVEPETGAQTCIVCDQCAKVCPDELINLGGHREPGHKIKVLDYFDPADKYNGDLIKAFDPIKAKLLILSFSSDWRFSPSRSKEISNALIGANKRVSFIILHYDHQIVLFCRDLNRHFTT